MAELFSRIFRPGDIWTHMYGGNRGEQDPKTLGPSQAMIDGRKKGILFDVGHGAGSFIWRVSVPLMKAGFLPDTISTDLHTHSMNAGLKDMMKGASTQNYIGDRAHGTFTTISDIQSYNEGTLLIDIVDATSQQLVWQASAKADVDQSLGPKERDARVNGVVRAMLAHFPPQ